MGMVKMINRFLAFLRDNQGRGPGLSVKAMGDDEARIYLYDVIDDFWGIGATEFVTALEGITAGTIHLHINSPGGDVFAARAMVAAMQRHPANIIAHVDGLAASAATFLAVAADECEISEGGFFMIHNGWTCTCGNATDHLAAADLLGKVDDSIVSDYQKKTGTDAETVRDWMAAETWFAAAEAVESGFVDRLADDSASPQNSFDLSVFGKVPTALRAAPPPEPESGVPTDAPPPEFSAMRAGAGRRLKMIELG